jgi:hypothetical protein
MLAERAVIGLNESATRKVMHDRQADTPVKALATAFLKWIVQIWAKPQHNPSATIVTMAITPKYLNFCRTGWCCCISAQADRETAPRLSKTAHFGFFIRSADKPVDDASRSTMPAGRRCQPVDDEWPDVA